MRQKTKKYILFYIIQQKSSKLVSENARPGVPDAARRGRRRRRPGRPRGNSRTLTYPAAQIVNTLHSLNIRSSSSAVLAFSVKLPNK